MSCSAVAPPADAAACRNGVAPLTETICQGGKGPGLLRRSSQRRPPTAAARARARGAARTQSQALTQPFGTRRNKQAACAPVFLSHLRLEERRIRKVAPATHCVRYGILTTWRCGVLVQ